MAKFNKLEGSKIFKKVGEDGTSFKKVGDSECTFKLIDDPNCRFKKAGYTFKPVGEDGIFVEGESIFKKPDKNYLFNKIKNNYISQERKYNDK